MSDHPYGMPEIVLQENSKQLIRRLNRELDGGAEILWFASLSPAIGSPAARKVDRIIVIGWLVWLLLWPFDTMPYFLAYGIAVSVCSFVWLCGSFGWASGGTPARFVPKNFVCLNLLQKTVSYYRGSTLEHAEQLDSQYGLWTTANSLQLTHAREGEKGSLITLMGMLPRHEFYDLSDKLCRRLALRQIALSERPTRKSEGNAIILTGSVLLAGSLLYAGYQYLANFRTLHNGPEQTLISAPAARIIGRYICTKGNCSHTLSWRQPEGTGIPVSCEGVPEMCNHRQRQAVFEPVELTLRRFQRREYRMLKAVYRDPTNGKTVRIDRSAEMDKTAEAFREQVRRNMPKPFYAAGLGILIILAGRLYRRSG